MGKCNCRYRGRVIVAEQARTSDVATPTSTWAAGTFIAFRPTGEPEGSEFQFGQTITTLAGVNLDSRQVIEGED